MVPDAIFEPNTGKTAAAGIEEHICHELSGNCHIVSPCIICDFPE